MHTYYFTFGSNHEDRNGESLGNAFVPIHADDEESARERMMELRGDKWSMCYASRDSFGIEKYNLREVTEFEIDTREQRKEAAIEQVVAAARANLERRLASLDKLKELMRKLPADIIPKCTEYDCQLDINNLTRAESVVVLASMQAGKWKKEANSAYDGALNYDGEVDGAKVRLWAAAAPETCHVVEYEEVIPEQRVIRRKLVCSPSA